jgi:hypothetical protein
MSSLEIYDVNTWWGLVRGKSVALSSSPSISRKKKKKVCHLFEGNNFSPFGPLPFL